MQTGLYSPFSLTKHVRRAAERVASRSRTCRLSKQNTFDAQRNVSPLEAGRVASRSRTCRLSKQDVSPLVGGRVGMRADTNMRLLPSETVVFNPGAMCRTIVFC